MSADSISNSHHRTPFSEANFDEATFEVFFKQHFLPLCLYCQFKFGFGLDLAKEAVHTAFIKLWESRHRSTRGLLPLRAAPTDGNALRWRGRKWMTHRFLGSPSENNGLCPQPGLAETLLFGGFTSRLAAAC